MAILVTGGAGYIGSHAVRALTQAGEKAVVYDNLTTGFSAAVRGHELIVGDLSDKNRLAEVMHNYNVDSVLHFAAYSQVNESMLDPGKYYNNNIGGTLSLLEAMRKMSVKRIVFSSSASVYGESKKIPITEDCPLQPTSVYGTTKRMIETILKDYEAAYGIRSISLRYFNVAGADESGEIGEAHNPETHLVPIALQVIQGRRDHMRIYGTDYPTKDGTCVRDYIHVTDLVDAHLLALKALAGGAATTAYNLGSGEGFSVRDIVDSVERVTGQKLKVSEDNRRLGDPAVLIASSERIIKELGWEPKHTEIDKIVSTAWKWHNAHPFGYA